MLIVPSVSPAFRWSHEPWGAALRSTTVDAWAQHLFTTRQLQLRSSADGRAWEYIASSVGAAPDRLLRVKQIHGNTVRVVRANEIGPHAVAARPEADAIVSNAAGAVLVVQVADCVPMLIVDSRNGAAGAVHAGWRGTRAGVGAETVRALAREFGSRPGELQIALGPSIGACCYEVGEELLDAFRATGAQERDLARWFTRAEGGSLRLDLWAANRDQLIAAGVPRDHIHLSRLCTQTFVNVFESYRVEGSRAGRMVAAIRVPTASGR